MFLFCFLKEKDFYKNLTSKLDFDHWSKIFSTCTMVLLWKSNVISFIRFTHHIHKIFRTLDLWPWPWSRGHWDSKSSEISSRCTCRIKLKITHWQIPELLHPQTLYNDVHDEWKTPPNQNFMLLSSLCTAIRSQCVFTTAQVLFQLVTSRSHFLQCSKPGAVAADELEAPICEQVFLYGRVNDRLVWEHRDSQTAQRDTTAIVLWKPCF